ncbi:lectin like domain-containing protein [Vallitalea okinawensis]|uniref:lectin like domain-containing protein n=1 Tax=Vallitalea okinawensis TaxID=2078660 RepID=UPI000CFCEBF6|nr:lectin like domain-containing protein [Vallitalea okinawensis]
MKKRIQALGILMVLLCINIIPVTAQELDLKLSIDGDYIEFTDESGKPYVDNNGRTQVPVRIAADSIGAKVEWDGNKEAVILQKDTVTVMIFIGTDYIYVEGDKIMNDTVSTVINGRTYLPIRVVMEAFGYTVGWDQETFTVSANSPGYVEPEENVSQYPESFDARTVSKMSPVKNQGDIGACWAFAAMGALETSLMPDMLYDFSEDHISLNHGYALTQDQGGDYQIGLAYLTGWKGPILEEQDPYGDGETTEAEAVVHLQEAIFIDDKDFDGIKKAVMEYGAVHTSVYSPILNGDQNSLYYNEETNAMYNFDDNVQDHDIIIVGWDDNYPRDKFKVKPSKDGAFICKNSWGEEFGEGGYYYVSYEDTHIGTHNVIYTRIDSNDNYDNIYQYDELGWVSKIGYENGSEDKAMAANVYTASNEEILEAISFYSFTKNGSYKLYVVEDFVDTKSFDDKVFLTEGTLEEPGYYTIDLPVDVNLSKGERYAVVLEINSPGLKHPIAIEVSNQLLYTDEIEVNPGESFISYSGKNWQDAGKDNNVNVCIKAFTNNVE